MKDPLWVLNMKGLIELFTDCMILRLSVFFGSNADFYGVLAHSQRLVSVQSMLKQAGRYHTLERDLMDLQERKLFEYFLVVALHKTKAGAPYLPEVTQQFPLKVSCHLM